MDTFHRIKTDAPLGLSFYRCWCYQSVGRTGLILKMLKYINKIIAYEIFMQFYKSLYQDIIAPLEQNFGNTKVAIDIRPKLWKSDILKLL